MGNWAKYLYAGTYCMWCCSDVTLTQPLSCSDLILISFSVSGASSVLSYLPYDQIREGLTELCIPQARNLAQVTLLKIPYLNNFQSRP